jgi:hypothetical protein
VLIVTANGGWVVSSFVIGLWKRTTSGVKVYNRSSCCSADPALQPTLKLKLALSERKKGILQKIAKRTRETMKDPIRKARAAMANIARHARSLGMLLPHVGWNPRMRVKFQSGPKEWFRERWVNKK